MIDSAKMNFHDDLMVDVNILVDGMGSVRGQLLVEKNTFPMLSFKCEYRDRVRAHSILREHHEVVECESNLGSFHLYNNEVTEQGVFPKYIIGGKSLDGAKGFHFTLTGLYVFFNWLGGFRQRDSLILKEIINVFIRESFFYKDIACSIEIIHDVDFNDSVNKTTITEEALIVIEREEGLFSFDDVQFITDRIRVVFSLLMAANLGIKYVNVFSEKAWDSSSLHFVSTAPQSEPFNGWGKSFIVNYNLIDKTMWKEIFLKAFAAENNELFESLWVRLVSLHSFEGYWDYHILGYVSLLDEYSGRVTKKMSKVEIPPSEFKNMKGRLLEIVCEVSKKEGMDVFADAFDGAKNYILKMKKSSTIDFRDKFKLLLSTVNKDLVEVINFRDEDFSYIKNIRDNAAHGRPLGFGVKEEHFRTFYIKEKIRVLLSFFAFKLLGFNEVDFLFFLAGNRNRIVDNAGLDEFSLDRVTESCPIINVDLKAYECLESESIYDVVLFKHENDGFYTLPSGDLLSIVNDWRGKGIRDRPPLFEYLLKISNLPWYYCVEYVSELHVVNDNNHMKKHGVLIMIIKKL